MLTRLVNLTWYLAAASLAYIT